MQGRMYDKPDPTFGYQHGGRPSIIIDSSDHAQHRLSRMRRPLYSLDEMGILAMGWIVIGLIHLFIAFPC